MPARDLDLLIAAAEAAGRIALRFFRGANQVWDKGGDDPVSEADYAVDRHLREVLLAARPDYGWLSEETEDDHGRLAASRVFVVDPIDGTRAFVAGHDTWAHSLAVVEDGVPMAAVVLLPAKDRIYAATRGGGAVLNGAAIRCSGADGAEGATFLSNRATLEPQHWPGGVPPVERHFRPSLAYRLALAAEGRFDAMATLRDSWEWDIAGGALIAAEAGATVTDRFGADLRFNNRHPVTSGVVAAPGGLHADLLSRLKRP